MLIKQLQRHASECGEEAVACVIEESIASGYQGILFDRIQPGPEPEEVDFGPPEIPAWQNRPLERAANFG